MSENQITDLRAFFSTEEKPVKTSEMMEFWKSLSDEEKQYYKTTGLS